MKQFKIKHRDYKHLEFNSHNEAYEYLIECLSSENQGTNAYNYFTDDDDIEDLALEFDIAQIN